MEVSAPRFICLGLAELKLKVIATVLLRDFKVEFVSPDESTPKIKYMPVLALDSPHRMKITRR